MSWVGSAARRSQESCSATNAHGPGRERRWQDTIHPTRCARARHTLDTPAQAAPAGAQARSQQRGHSPAGQDTVETLKQAYFQGYPESAGCVQGSIDSRNSAIHSAYRISLRPSSLFEPRHPSLKVVIGRNTFSQINKRNNSVNGFAVPDGCREVP